MQYKIALSVLWQSKLFDMEHNKYNFVFDTFSTNQSIYITAVDFC